jgi:hypothetical protein
MLREFWLKLTDARVGAVLYALHAPGRAMGDLAASPSSAPAFFRPLRRELDKARSAPSSPAAAEALAAAEDFAGRLEKVFADMALHGVEPDAAVSDALLRLQASCSGAGALLSAGKRAKALERVRGLCAGAAQALDRSRRAAEADPAGFPQNLKFSSIYSGLAAATDALERCAEALCKV